MLTRQFEKMEMAARTCVSSMTDTFHEEEFAGATVNTAGLAGVP